MSVKALRRINTYRRFSAILKENFCDLNRVDPLASIFIHLAVYVLTKKSKPGVFGKTY